MYKRQGRERLGFLYDATKALTSIGLQIASAHISTYGERVVDVFYVKDVFGLRIEHEDKLVQIKCALMDAIELPKDTQPDKFGKNKLDKKSPRIFTEV